MKTYELYNRRREEARRDQNLRRQAVMARSAGLAALLKEKTALYVRRGLALARGADSAVVDRRLAEIRAALAAELARLGYPPDYLDARPFCGLCGDTGFISGQPCACAHRQDTPLFADFDLSRFPQGAQTRQAEQLLAFAQEYVRGYPDCPRRNVLLSGGTGLGKTYTLCCMAGELARRGVRTEILTAYEMIQSIMAQVLGQGNYGYLRKLEEVPVLVLDDLGSEPLIPNVTHEYMFSLINERFSGSGCTLIATNLTAGEIERRYGERTCSRLLDTEKTRAIRLTGADLRTYKPSAG